MLTNVFDFVNIMRADIAAYRSTNAGVAQPVEQLICNQQVVGSIPIASSILNKHNKT